MVLLIYIAIICYLPIVDDFLPKTNFGEGIPDIGPYRLGFFLLFLFFIMHGVIKKDIRLIHPWISILAFFYGVVVASISWSTYSYNTWLLQELFNTVFTPFFLAVVAINLFSNEKNADLFVRHMVFTVFILAIISVSQMVMGFMTGQTQFRAAGPLGNPNRLAVVIVLTIPCMLYAIEKGLISVRTGWFVSMASVVGIICTVSRKGIITMVLCYVLYSLLRKNYRRVVTLLISFALLAMVVSGYSVVTQRFEKEEFLYHMNEKWGMSKAGVRMFITKPLIGLGYEGYYQNFRRFYEDAHRDNYDAHNIYITALANYGLLGMIPFLMIFLYPLVKAIKIIRKNDTTRKNLHSVNMAILCLSTLIPFIIIGWFSGGLFYSYYAIAILFTNISLLLVSYPRDKNHTGEVNREIPST